MYRTGVLTYTCVHLQQEHVTEEPIQKQSQQLVHKFSTEWTVDVEATETTPKQSTIVQW